MSTPEESMKQMMADTEARRARRRKAMLKFYRWFWPVLYGGVGLTTLTTNVKARPVWGLLLGVTMLLVAAYGFLNPTRFARIQPQPPLSALSKALLVCIFVLSALGLILILLAMDK